MAFDNQILSNRAGQIIFTCNQAIEIGRFQIKAVHRYKCPLQTVNITDTDQWNYLQDEGIFEPDDPGKYLIQYVPI